jgi:GNAT superfamily N-acetyltransferase
LGRHPFVAECNLITYLELNSKSPEFHEAYEVICLDIAPEFVEPEDYIRERFRIQERGAKTEDERRMVPDGYWMRLLVAKDTQTNKIVGAITSNFIPKIGKINSGFALIGFLAVRQDYRRQGMGQRLVEEISKIVDRDSIEVTGKRAVGLLFEIEDEGKEPIEKLVLKKGGYPLDIDYYQPSVREGCNEQPMNLWLIPFDQPVKSPEDAKSRKYPVTFIHDMVRSLFIYEYPGSDRTGFKETSKAYLALVSSLKGKAAVGFRIGEI